MTLNQLRTQGFDRSTRAYPTLRVGCSQCEAVCVNGIPTHEHGCPNETHACRGCSEPIPRGVQYCEDCA